MARLGAGRHAHSFGVLEDIVGLVVVILTCVVSTPNLRFYGVMAAAQNELNKNSDVNSERGGPGGCYSSEEVDDFQPSSYNPLWRAEMVYTGERRGPVTTPDDYGPSSLRRPRRTGGRSPSAHSPLAPHIYDIDDASSSATASTQQYLDLQQRRQEQYQFEEDRITLSSPGEFPLQSADIGSISGGSNRIGSFYNQNPSFRRAYGIRKWISPVDFQRQKGRLNVGSSTLASLGPFSMVTLLQNGIVSIVGIGSVYIGTLKLLGPMILARQLLATIGYACYDYYDERFVRKTPTSKRIRYLKEYEAFAAARAATRTLLQIICMGCTGRFVGFVLDRTPCTLRPSWVCHWWYGVVWLAAIYAVGLACQESVFGYLAKTNHIFDYILSIQPVSAGDGSMNIKRRRRRSNLVQPLFRLAERMSQDPGEWMNREVSRKQNKKDYIQIDNKASARGTDDVKLDPLLFPSTWKPLFFVTFLGVSKAICEGVCRAANDSDPADDLRFVSTYCMERKDELYSILRSFVVQTALYNEWHRVFARERRVALGASVSVIALVAQIWMIHSVSIVDRIAAVALVPTLVARIISSWMNIVLYKKRFDVSIDSTPGQQISFRRIR
mmetsp:Transcript_63582/g.129549  ORF Transcript_63582/g.129549 Transcript_63582/m.129549 type:complete len:610 (+) Transcript_63582:73-1902(+)